MESKKDKISKMVNNYLNTSREDEIKIMNESINGKKVYSDREIAASLLIQAFKFKSK
jgi:hypothetical protein